jgi:predicted AlkP superfamily phosphohydrolase/phosphomutase
VTLISRPVVLFGIDGATYSILDPLINQGRLPNLSRLKQEGASGVLQSTIHPVTPAAWVSMVTGLNPGKHGVYDFRRRKEARYGWELVNRQSWSGDPVWSVLASQGKEIGIFNVPMTYPPHPVNGFVLSGMGTPPRSQNFIYPPNLSAKFQQHFPTYAVEPDTRTDDLNEYFLRLERLLDQRIEALRFVWGEYPQLDFFMPVFIETDRVHHVYWRFVDPTMQDYREASAAKWRERIATLYEKIDAVLGELWAWITHRQGYILVVSDHGFGPLLRDVYLNQWLINQGYLTLKPNAASHLEGHFFDQVDWDKTRAYSFGLFGNISLNLHGREPRGIVEPGREAEALKREITSQLSQLVDPETGEVIVDVVYRREELYSGIYLDRAPDLLVVMKDYAYMTRDGFDFNSNQLMGPPLQYNKYVLPHSGNHRLGGIILMAGEGIRVGTEIQEASITDIAPTVLYMAGSPVPTGLDGQVLLNAFDETFVASRPPASVSPEAKVTPTYKPLKVQKLEKDVQISLLDDEVRKLRQLVAEKDLAIRELEDVIQRFKNGRVMRLLAWLQGAKTR